MPSAGTQWWPPDCEQIVEARELSSIYAKSGGALESSGDLTTPMFARHGAVVRILHPAHRKVDDGEMRSVRWEDIAGGRALGCTTGFEEISASAAPDVWHEPPDDSLSKEEAQSLAEILSTQTTTADRCVLLLWSGHGALKDMGAGGPAIGDREGERYYAFEGPVTSLSRFEFGPWFVTPNLCFPLDEAWVVATPLDSTSTFVAGSPPCVEAICGSQLEALRCR